MRGYLPILTAIVVAFTITAMYAFLFYSFDKALTIAFQ